MYTYIAAYISLYYGDEQTNKTMRPMMTHASCMRHPLSHIVVHLLNESMRQIMTHARSMRHHLSHTFVALLVSVVHVCLHICMCVHIRIYICV